MEAEAEAVSESVEFSVYRLPKTQLIQIPIPLRPRQTA